MQATFAPYKERDRVIPELWDRLVPVDSYVLVAYVNDEAMEEPVIVRWKRPASGYGTIHCAVWVRLKEYRVGYAKAGGYGYCKRSQAFADALKAAGVKLSVRVDGAGMEKVREAMLAIGQTLVGDEPMIVVEG